MNPLTEETVRARRVLLAQARWVLAITILVTVAAGVFVKTRAPTYDATATVTVSLQTFDGTPVASDMSTEQQIASSSGVASIAARTLGITNTAVLGGLSVTAPTAGQVLEITYSASTAATARQRANAVAHAYVTYRNSQAATVTSSGSQLIPTASVLSPASLPGAPAGPRLLVTLAAAVVLGLALGVVVAFARDWLDDRVRDPRDVESREIPSLGTVPVGVLPLGATNDGTDAYRRLRDKVGIEIARRQARTLVVAGAEDDADTGDVAINLCIALARSGRQVVLVETRPNDDLVHELVDAESSSGLSGLLRDAGDVATELRATPVPGLKILPAGGPFPDAADRLAGPGMTQVVAELTALADLVVIDSGNLMSSTRTLAVAPLSDLAMLVARAGVTRIGQVTDAAAELRRARLELIGCVLATATATTRAGEAAERSVVQRARGNVLRSTRS